MGRPGKARSHNLGLREPDCGPAANWLEEPPDPKVRKGMHAAEKSDTGIVPKKGLNKASVAGGGGPGGKAGDQGEFCKDDCELYAGTGGSIERTGQDTGSSGARQGRAV